MTNIIMIAKNRPNLTRQAIDSLYRHTDPSLFNLTVIDDGSDAAVSPEPQPNMLVVRLSRSKGIVGLARNLGATISERYWGRGQWLLFLDNDIAILRPDWLIGFIWAAQLNSDLKVLGGYRHPFHGVNRSLAVTGTTSKVELTDAVAGYSLLMRWDDWDKYGPFDANQPGPGASEDFALCQRAVKDGGVVGYIHPPVLAHCGLRNTDGVPATGHEAFERIGSLLYE